MRDTCGISGVSGVLVVTFGLGGVDGLACRNLGLVQESARSSGGHSALNATNGLIREARSAGT